MQGKQGRLFDHLPVPGEAGRQVRIAGSGNRLDPAQRTFNRLSEEVGRLQEEIERWQQRIIRLGQRLQAEMMPGIERLGQAQKDVVVQLDALLSLPKDKLRLSRAKRETLGAYIFMLTDEILSLRDDPEIAAIRERYLGLDQQEEAELEQALARGLLGEMFGEEALEGYAGDDLEEMIAHAKARHEETSRPQGRRRTKKERAIEEAKEAADTALREAYRKLASHLHPDREPNPEERERKTALMQRANSAYEKRDLMGLLQLQMECAQLDADALGELPEARIKRFIEALREQIETLKLEKEGMIQAASDLLDVEDFILACDEVQDSGLDALFDDRLEQLNRTCSHVQNLARDLAKPSRRDAAIKRILSEMDDVWGGGELDALADSWGFPEDEPVGPPAGRKGKRRSPRR
jgi:archaellum component FlaC